MDEFYKKLAEVLDLDEVKPTDVIEDLPDWDSLAALTVIAMLGSRFGIHLETSELNRLKTVQELHDLVALGCTR
jgi:acyl carrier protein